MDWEQPVLMVTRTRLEVRIGARAFRWHPGLLHARREAGMRHPLARAMRLRRGDVLLDTTLGLGVDAVWLRQLFGANVMGVEASPAIALMTSEGLSAAGLSVPLICAESGAFLASLPSNAVDVVYCDPLFERRQLGDRACHTLDGVRAVGFRGTIDANWLQHALRVARRQVVIRDHWDGTLLHDLGAPEMLARKKGVPRVGWWDVS